MAGSANICSGLTWQQLAGRPNRSAKRVAAPASRSWGETRLSASYQSSPSFMAHSPPRERSERGAQNRLELVFYSSSVRRRPARVGRYNPVMASTRILGIETSCDETAAALVVDGRHIESNVVASQDDVHRETGGVVPEIASRLHLRAIGPVVERALSDAGRDWGSIDLVAVTHGPGLAGALLVGLNTAKALSFAQDIPLLGVNHLEGHVYANWLVEQVDPQFPLVCLIVSGGHSDLVLMREHGEYVRLGHTLDDAAGEAFDKAARMMGLGYPGGPAVQKAAEGGDPGRYPLPRAWLRPTSDFS